MHPSIHAKTTPHKPAIIMASTGETVTYQELDARSNQAAQLFRQHGLKPGDRVSILMDNNARYHELVWAAQRAGLYFTCISSKLTAPEVAYIVEDSGSKLVFVSASLRKMGEELPPLVPDARCFSVGGDISGHERYEPARDAMPQTPVSDQVAGMPMLYSSGTTGRPKGVMRALTGEAFDADTPARMLIGMLFGINENDVYLSPAPLYHAAPLNYTCWLHRWGATVVVMEHFDPEQFLALVEKHRVTVTQVAPTMFVRMLKLPEAVRAKYDVSSMRSAIHAGAPCSVPIKQQMIDWWGPVIYEYYAGTEGNGLCMLDSHEWLLHRGSVGKAIGVRVVICDDEGNEVPQGQTGTVYFEGGNEFAYHNDPKKTAESRHPTMAQCSTLGDVGYLDADGYLYLTDRKSFMIISGGVNIYPQEIENLLITHPKVADVAVFGVPNEDFGEEVKAVIQPQDWNDATPETAAELIAFCRASLSHIKCPRSVDFDKELPRHATGKLYKRLLRDRYWGDRTTRIV